MSKLFGVVVLYNPPNVFELKENIASYINELDHLICVDNSENGPKIENFKNSKITYVSMEKNIGLAKALSYGVKLAINQGADYIAQFDQDSILEKFAMTKMYECIKKDDSIGIIGPNINLIYRQNNIRSFSRECLYNKYVKEVEWIITSGSIISRAAYLAINGIDEKLFISGIDRDLCCRVKEKNYKIILMGTVTLFQEAGNTKEKNILGKKIHPPYLNQKRYYYIFRNELYLRRKNGKNYTKCKTNLLKYLICAIFFEDKKFNKCKAIIEGISDSRKMLF